MRRLASCLLLFIFLFSCISQPPQTSPETRFYIYRFEPPAFVEFSADFQQSDEIPFSLPPNCWLFNIFPSPSGRFLLIELSCPNGQTVLFLDVTTASVNQPIQDSDSHFLSWAEAGRSVVLRVDSLGAPRIVRLNMDTLNSRDISISDLTYDFAARPGTDQFSFTLSRGLGYGSEIFLAKGDGQTLQSLYADQYNYLSFAEWSPDGEQIAFLKIPDTQTPFTVGELWVMNADGSNPRKLADADAGHGYAAHWSPDGKRIAFVVRANPEDENANQSGNALISNVYMVDVGSGSLIPVTHLEAGYVETPVWSPDGNTLAFPVVINDRMEVRIADLATGEIRSLITESTCCPAWMRK